MNCPNCGVENEEGSAFCKDCGSMLASGATPPAAAAGLGGDIQPPSPDPFMGPPPAEQLQPPGGPPPVPPAYVQPPPIQQGPVQQPPAPPPPGMPYQPMPPYGQPVYMAPHPIYGGMRTDGLCVAGMIMGILGIVLFWIPIFGWICGLLGAIFGAVGMANVKKSPAEKTGYGMGVAGLITGIIGVSGGVIFFILAVSASTW